MNDSVSRTPMGAHGPAEVPPRGHEAGIWTSDTVAEALATAEAQWQAMQPALTWARAILALAELRDQAVATLQAEPAMREGLRREEQVRRERLSMLDELIRQREQRLEELRQHQAPEEVALQQRLEGARADLARLREDIASVQIHAARR
jgi:hypothetical protein